MLEKIKKILADNLGVNADEITEQTAFEEDLHADSLDLFEIVMALEDEFEMEIPTEDLENLRTVGDVIAYVEEHR